MVERLKERTSRRGSGSPTFHDINLRVTTTQDESFWLQNQNQNPIHSEETMQWVSPCGNQCTNKYNALTQIPWRVFCKKGCNADGDTWEECLEACDQICYKDPVLKDQKWSAYIDRSPGAASYSEECFHACVSGCGYKFDVLAEQVDKVCPNRPLKPPKPAPVQKPKPPPVDSANLPEDTPGTSA